MAIRNVFKNSVYELLKGAGVDPSELQCIEHAELNNVILISHERSSCHLYLKLLEDATGSVWGSPGLRTDSFSETFNSWAQAAGFICDWANRLREELGTPDLWEEAAKASELLEGPSPEAENSPFTEAEHDNLSQKLLEVEQHVLRIAEQVAAVHDQTADDAAFKAYVRGQFEYLEGATTRLGRVDWWKVFVSSIMSIVIQAFLPPDQLQALLLFARDQVYQVVQPAIEESLRE